MGVMYDCAQSLKQDQINLNNQVDGKYQWSQDGTLRNSTESYVGK